MALRVYLEENFNAGSEVDRVDVFTGDNVTVTFTLSNKTAARLASTIQVNDLEYRQFIGEFTKSNVDNTFTLINAPAENEVIIAPGVVQIVAEVFDQDDIPGVTNPRQVDIPLYLGDITEITSFKYRNMPADVGIKLSITDYITATIASVGWCQLACANGLTGAAMSYQATGTDLFLSGLFAYGTLVSSASASSTTISLDTVLNNGAFQVGDYVLINPGESNQEIRKIASINLSTKALTFTTGLDYAHSPGEFVFTCGRKFWLRVTVPLNAAGNEAAAFYDLAVTVTARQDER